MRKEKKNRALNRASTMSCFKSFEIDDLRRYDVPLIPKIDNIISIRRPLQIIKTFVSLIRCKRNDQSCLLQVGLVYKFQNGEVDI